MRSKIPLSIFTCLFIAACGGGGGSSNTGSVSGEVSERRFNNVIFQPGAAIISYKADIQLQDSFPSPNQNITADFSLQLEARFALNIISLNSTEISVCGETSNIESDQLNFSNGEDLLTFFGASEPSELPNSFCENFDVRYFSSDNSSASAQLFCDSTRVASIDYSHISNQPNVSFGSFTLDSPQLSNINSSNVQCGTLFNAIGSVIYSPQPNQLGLMDLDDDFDSLSFEIPYGNQGNFLIFYFQPDEPLTTRTYTINSFASSVDLTSREFGVTNGEPNSLIADSGIVTISSVSVDSVIGSYDLVAEGNILSGNFSIDLN